MKLWCLLFICLLYARAEVTFDIPEIDYLDTSVNPCDDFYQYSCGNFKKFHQRPKDDNIVDHFTLLEDEMINIGHEILSSSILDADPVALRKAKTAYKACSDKEILASEVVPELTTIQEFGGLPLISPSNQTTKFSWYDLAHLVANNGIPMVFVFNIVQPSQNDSLIVVSKDTLPNPSLFQPNSKLRYEDVLEEDFKAQGRKRTTRSVKVQPFDIFLQTITKHLLLATNSSKSENEAFRDLNSMANFMRKMYGGGIQDGKMVPIGNTLSTVKELQEWTNQQFGGEVDINWVEYFNIIFQMAGVEITSATKINNLVGLDYIYGVLNLVRLTDPKVLKNYAMLRVILFQAPDSDYTIRRAFEQYYFSKGYKLYPRWEYCTRKILDVVDSASFSFAVTYGYKQYHYNLNKIPQAVDIVKNIQKALTETIASADWMDEESRDAALRKVDKMLILMAYPNFVEDGRAVDNFYENLEVCEWDNYGNARRIRAFKQAYQFTLLRTKDRNFWGLSPFDPNAYYNRPNNRIVLPISMLNPMFFYGDNPLLDYSRLGFLVGHEMNHAFDYNGLAYNEDGTNVHLWTDQTNQIYSDRTSCLKQQYSQYYVEEIKKYVNGSYCINENIADNGGLSTAFSAYKKLIDNDEIKVAGNYTAEQLFFIGFGTMWCSDESVNYLNRIIGTSNGYPPKRFRAIGTMSNMEEFSKAFHCPVGSTMNPGSTRCQIW